MHHAGMLERHSDSCRIATSLTVLCCRYCGNKRFCEKYIRYNNLGSDWAVSYLSLPVIMQSEVSVMSQATCAQHTYWAYISLIVCAVDNHDT